MRCLIQGTQNGDLYKKSICDEKRCLDCDTGADGDLVVGEELDELLGESKCQ